MSKGTISVVIPAFNAEHFLESCIGSLKKQTRLPDEIIVVNDGSTDATGEVALGLGVGTIVHLPKNKGIGYSRHHGALESTCDYVAFLSADDKWASNFLEVMMKHVGVKHVTFCDYYRCHNDMQPSGVFKAPHHQTQDEFKQLVIEWALNKNMFTNFSGCIFPRWVFDEVKFRTDLRRGEDLVFLLESVIAGVKWLHVPEPLLYYRESAYRQTYEEWDLLWSEIIPLLEKLGVNWLECELAKSKNYSVIFPRLEVVIYHKLRQAIGKLLK